MSLLEIILIGVALVCCIGGVAWLLYDLNKQVNAYREAMKQDEESTLGLVEDDEE